MKIYDSPNFLKNLRGKQRRAMELAIADAEASYAAACKEAEALYTKALPIVEAAYVGWQEKMAQASKEFLASLPPETLKEIKSYFNIDPSIPFYNHADPFLIKTHLRSIYNSSPTLDRRIALCKLRSFLLSKQEEQSENKPKNTKRDTEARKLLTEFDASKTLCSTNPAPPTPNPDGSIDAERI